MRVLALRTLRSQNLQALLTGCYVVLGSSAIRAAPGPMASACWLLMGAVGVLAWAAALRRARAIAELPTSRIGSAAQGYVELQGRASVDQDNLIVSPVSGVQCIWYRYRLYSRDAADKDWNEVDMGVSSATFEIRDGSGACRIDPDHAEVVGAEVRTSYPQGDKLVEELLFGGLPIYALGEFSTLGGAGSALSLREDVNTLLADWKADPSALRRRFDLNRDGEVDLKEWELARRLAHKTVEQQHRTLRAEPGVHMLRAPQDGRLFLISALAPRRMRRRFLLWSALHLSAALLAFGLWVRLQSGWNGVF